MTLSDRDAFAIRNQGPGGTMDLSPDPEAVANVRREFERVPISNPGYLDDGVEFFVARIDRAGADVAARVTANEALVRERADRALVALDEALRAIAPADGGRLFHSLANALALRSGESGMVRIAAGLAIDDLSGHLEALGVLRSGLVDVVQAYTKPGRKGGPDAKDIEFHALLEVARVYRAATGAWPTIRTGGQGDGVEGHFVDVVRVACEEVGALDRAGRPIFTEAVYRRVRTAIKSGG